MSAVAIPVKRWAEDEHAAYGLRVRLGLEAGPTEQQEQGQRSQPMPHRNPRVGQRKPTRDPVKKEEASKVQKWDYFYLGTYDDGWSDPVMVETDNGSYDFDSYVAWLGEQGWELVSATRDGDCTSAMNTVWIFKRLKV